MLNSTIVIKVKQRINKLDSQDYDNLECWQIVEAFNKAQVEWCYPVHGPASDLVHAWRKCRLQVQLWDDRGFQNNPSPGLSSD